MFSFFHRSSVINVDCFTDNNDAYKFTPIVRATKAKPSWYEHVRKPELANTKWPQYKADQNGTLDFNWHVSLRTVKSCPGFHDLYSRGFILENWCDLAFNVQKDRLSWHHSNGQEPLLHNSEQAQPGFMNHYIVKLRSPWIIQTKESVPFVLFGAEWSLEDYDFRVIPGVVNFHEQTSTNVFLAVSKAREQQFYIPMGQPLVQFMPLSDKKIKVHNHVVTSEELRTKIYDVRGTSFGWRRTRALVRRNDQREKKCPFGFGD